MIKQVPKAEDVFDQLVCSGGSGSKQHNSLAPALCTRGCPFTMNKTRLG